jgi:hypothetical protein
MARFFDAENANDTRKRLLSCGGNGAPSTGTDSVEMFDA